MVGIGSSVCIIKTWQAPRESGGRSDSQPHGRKFDKLEGVNILESVLVGEDLNLKRE